VRILIILAIFAGLMVAVNLVSFVVNRLLSPKDLAGIAPRGKMISVNGRRMHLRWMGEGEKTIVLLPGLGVPLPSVDFEPLMRALSEKYTTVCVEYFGYGHSDGADRPRTNENYAEEIRAALSLAGFKSPYILMPYSASGIYGEYYATKYPAEVEALILLDTTSSAHEEKSVPRFVLTLARFQNAIGMNRFLNSLILPKAMGVREENGYSKQDIREILKFSNHASNQTTEDQLLRFPANVSEVMAMDFPEGLPVLQISAGKRGDKWGKYRAEHRNRLGEHAQCTLIEGSNHGNIYHDHKHRTAVLEAVDRFLGSHG